MEMPKNLKLWQVFAPITIAGAILLGGFRYSCLRTAVRENKSLETKVVQSSQEIERLGDKTTEINNPKIPERYSYLEKYNEIIEEYTAYFNNKHKINLDSSLVKAIIAEESGEDRFRNHPNYDNSFDYDPMQIANKGDYALETLSNGGENTHLIGDFSRLKGMQNTPWNNKELCWDYSSTNMTAENSIFGGIGWFVHKAAIYSTRIVEDGELKEHIVKSGDNLWDIAKENGTTVETLKKYTNRLTDKIIPNQKLRFRNAREEVYISGWRPWEDAVERYNGRGNPNYIEEVYEILKEMKPQHN